MKSVNQPGAGPVNVFTDFGQALNEMKIAGCVDCTGEVKDLVVGIINTVWMQDPERFDWEDSKGDVYWHIVNPR